MRTISTPKGAFLAKLPIMAFRQIHIIIIIIIITYNLHHTFPMRPKAFTINSKTIINMFKKNITLHLQTAKKMCFQGLSESTD